jgi:hypothetical protein
MCATVQNIFESRDLELEYLSISSSKEVLYT